jgi:hypothetical protein
MSCCACCGSYQFSRSLNGMWRLNIASAQPQGGSCFMSAGNGLRGWAAQSLSGMCLPSRNSSWPARFASSFGREVDDLDADARRHVDRAAIGIRQRVESDFRMARHVEQRVDATADALPAFQQQHLESVRLEFHRGRQTRQARADHDDIGLSGAGRVGRVAHRSCDRDVRRSVGDELATADRHGVTPQLMTGPVMDQAQGSGNDPRSYRAPRSTAGQAGATQYRKGPVAPGPVPTAGGSAAACAR